MLAYIAQGIGIIGLLLAIISFQQRTKKGILLFQFAASSIFAVHFMLLGAYTGAAMNIYGALRNLFFYNRGKSWADKKIWLYLFAVICIITGAATYKNIFSILPVLGMLLQTFAYWIHNPKHVRHLSLAVSPLWMIYNIVNCSIAGIMTEVFILTSLIVAIIRFDYPNIMQRFNSRRTL